MQESVSYLVWAALPPPVEASIRNINDSGAFALQIRLAHIGPIS